MINVKKNPNFEKALQLFKIKDLYTFKNFIATDNIPLLLLFLDEGDAVLLKKGNGVYFDAYNNYTFVCINNCSNFYDIEDYITQTTSLNYNMDDVHVGLLDGNSPYWQQVPCLRNGNYLLSKPKISKFFGANVLCTDLSSTYLKDLLLYKYSQYQKSVITAKNLNILKL